MKRKTDDVADHGTNRRTLICTESPNALCFSLDTDNTAIEIPSELAISSAGDSGLGSAVGSLGSEVASTLPWLGSNDNEELAQTFDAADKPAFHREYTDRYGRKLDDLNHGYGRIHFERLLGDGLISLSDYSGYDAVRESLRHCTDFIAHGAPPIVHVRSCDKGRIQQRFLTMMSDKADEGKSCVFANLEDRIPATIIRWLDAAMPSKDSSKEEAARAFADMEEYLISCGEKLFTISSTSFCIKHSCQCPLYPTWAAACLDDLVRIAAENGFTDIDDVGIWHCLHLANSYELEAFMDLRCCWAESHRHASSARNTPYWYSQKSLPKVLQNTFHKNASSYKHQPLVIHHAGFECTDYTQLGERKGDSGQTNRPLDGYLVGRKRAAELQAESMFFNECHVSFQFHRRFALMRQTHLLLRVKANPISGGYPMPRNRMFGVGICLESFVWVGPTSEIELQYAFDMFFNEDSFSLTADDYLISEP
jgi:hypothetical protein